jgi:hypothetical protein
MTDFFLCGSPITVDTHIRKSASLNVLFRNLITCQLRIQPVHDGSLFITNTKIIIHIPAFQMCESV